MIEPYAEKNIDSGISFGIMVHLPDALCVAFFRECNFKIRNTWFTMTEHDEKNKAYITFTSKLAEHVRAIKRVTLKDKSVDNEKFAFRCFLRLGFIGEDRCRVITE